MRILIVEDDKDTADFLKHSLEAEMFSVDTSFDGEEGSYLARTNDYDLVILDHGLPRKSGAEVCNEIRATGKTMPILMLTVKSELSTKVETLTLGADDYVTKPFHFDEILARIRALLRRPKQLSAEVLRVGDLEIDSNKYLVKRSGTEIYLTRKEFQLLEYLMQNHGNVVTRGMIMEHVWDRQGDLFSNTIETHILNLRKKIDSRSERKLIQTIPGRGYKIAV